PDPVVPAYTAVDVHLGWRPTDRLELSVTGTNIFDRRHIEFGDVLTASEIDRAFQTRIVWKF
ncbi:MAG TPA: hypothetical protein VK660_04950, partial [Xanthomonadaceae bacterium]|nr:hypothetical protein [Xanthomonadaceae bacterium]